MIARRREQRLRLRINFEGIAEVDEEEPLRLEPSQDECAIVQHRTFGTRARHRFSQRDQAAMKGEDVRVRVALIPIELACGERLLVVRRDEFRDRRELPQELATSFCDELLVME